MTKVSSPPIDHGPPSKLTYLLTPWQVQRRAKGWYVRNVAGNIDEPSWSGPFATIESACLSVARGQARELADRHTRHVEFHKLKPGHPLYGLKPTTRLRKPRKTADATVA